MNKLILLRSLPDASDLRPTVGRLACCAIMVALPVVALAQERLPAKAGQQPPATAGAPAKPQDPAHQDAPATAYEKQEPKHGLPAEAGHGEAAEAGEEHGMLSALLWPTVNFLILAGGLYWFLAPALRTYLTDRHESIRKDLVEAANVRAAAAAELAEIDRKLQALPSELEALKRRGAEEIAAEEHRISAMAAAERDRLLEQTRREIEFQVRLAKRELVEHAADLSVQLASDRIQKSMTPADQDRLVDRYLNQVKGTQN
jgi:F0F1-type ATP synthase membrane subunit b/b'